MPSAEVLKRLLEQAVDDTVDNTVTLDLFNAALRDLATAARLPSKATISFVANDMTRDLPAGIVEVRSINVVFSNQAQYTLGELASLGYDVSLDGLTTIFWDKELPYDGYFKVFTYRMPSMLENLTATPEIAEVGHDALVEWAAWKILLADDEEKANIHQATYYTKKAELDTYTKRVGEGATANVRFMNARPAWARR